MDPPRSRRAEADADRAQRRPPRRRATSTASAAASRALAEPVDVVIKVDADVDFEPDFCERLMAGFEADPTLAHRQRHVLRARGRRVGAPDQGRHDRLGRDARLSLGRRRHPDGRSSRSWAGTAWTRSRSSCAACETKTFVDLPFRHHRPEGGRELTSLHQGEALGRASYYMGYRPTYLAMRAFYRARREPAALAMLWGYAAAAARRDRRCPDAARGARRCASASGSASRCAAARPPRDTVGVVIRTLNESELIGRCLADPGRRSAAPHELDVLVLDSGSTDDTIAIARAHGARVHEMAPEDFDYSKSLNVGIDDGRGRPDPDPVGARDPARRSNGSGHMTAPFADPNVVGVGAPPGPVARTAVPRGAPPRRDLRTSSGTWSAGRSDGPAVQQRGLVRAAERVGGAAVHAPGRRGPRLGPACGRRWLGDRL